MAVAFGLMVIVLLMAGTLGGIGNVELFVWLLLLAVVLVVVSIRAKRKAGGPGSG